MQSAKSEKWRFLEYDRHAQIGLVTWRQLCMLRFDCSMVYLFFILCFIIFYLNSIIEQKAEIDWQRNAKFAAIGAIWVGPYVHFCLGRIQQYARHWRLKIVLDQTLLMPVNMAVVNLRGFLLDNIFFVWYIYYSVMKILKVWKPLYKRWQNHFSIKNHGRNHFKFGAEKLPPLS